MVDLTGYEDAPLLDPDTEQWMSDQGMTSREKQDFRSHMARQRDPAASGSTAWQAARKAEDPAAHGRYGKYPPQDVLEAARERGEIPRHPPARTRLDMGDVTETVERLTTPPTIEEVLADPRSGRPPAPATTPAPRPSTDVTDTAPPAPSGIGARIGEDGRIIFTNVGATTMDPTTGRMTTAPMSDEDRARYAKAVGMWREKAARAQGPSDPGRPGYETPAHRRGTGIGVTGGLKEYGDFRVDPDAPLPGEKGYTPLVSQPYMADPTKPVTSEDWAKMSHGAKRTFVNEAAVIAATTGERADSIKRQAEARMASDPEYSVQFRMAMRAAVREEARTSAEVQNIVREEGERWLQANPGKSANSEEYKAILRQAEEVAVKVWMKREHPDIAAWDDTLSRNVGFSY